MIIQDTKRKKTLRELRWFLVIVFFLLMVLGKKHCVGAFLAETFHQESWEVQDYYLLSADIIEVRLDFGTASNNLPHFLYSIQINCRKIFQLLNALRFTIPYI